MISIEVQIMWDMCWFEMLRTWAPYEPVCVLEIDYFRIKFEGSVSPFRCDATNIPQHMYAVAMSLNTKKKVKKKPNSCTHTIDIGQLSRNIENK